MIPYVFVGQMGSLIAVQADLKTAPYVVLLVKQISLKPIKQWCFLNRSLIVAGSWGSCRRGEVMDNNKTSDGQ